MKLVILRGIPGSGKSTFAKQLCLEAGYKRVNKDSLRDMIDAGKWSAENEQIIELAQVAILQMLIEQNEPIVVDNTNGSERHIRRLTQMGELAGYTVEVKVFDTPVEECIERDAVRDNPVGEAVVRRHAEQPFFKQLYDKAG